MMHSRRGMRRWVGGKPLAKRAVGFDARAVRRQLAIEPLEPRIVFSHDGTDAVIWAMPASLEQSINEDMAAEASSATIYPGEQISFDTLANGLPILNSFPSAPAAIYLDFDGGVYHGNETLGAYDTDGNPAVFSSTEQLAIYEAWRQVSAYFAMFNLNVTTVDTTKPKAWILPSDAGSGGVSYVNVFPNNNSGPQSKTGAATVTSRISAISHELGHNFGTSHTSLYDALGVKTEEYHDAFDALHGPIMGLDYTGVIHKWSWWHDSSSDGGYTLQNDMAIIAADTNALDGAGDGYRPDDYGGTIASATPLPSFGVTQSATGIIERLSDADAFSFVSTGGRYAIVAGRDAPSGVDLKLSIYDSAGQLIASEDGDPRAAPLTMVNDQHITLDLPAGTYYAMVESHGNYGDQGQYVLRVDSVPTGWSAEDIGLVGVPGYSSYDAASSTYTVTGSGSDISSTADGFQYLYQTLDGDGQITARIASQENTNSSAKAGVMIRETLGDNSKNAMVGIKPGGGATFQYRTGTGSSTGSMNASGSGWQWVRLTRTGNSIKAEVSTNGTSWITVGTQTVTMGAQVLIGLATTARNNLKISQATYANVSVTGSLNAGPTLNDLPATSALGVTATSYNSATLTWNAVPVAGDANGDGVVNAADLTIVKNNFGSSSAAGTAADVNGDGAIDLGDYNLVKANMASSTAGFVVERSTDGINFASIGRTTGGTTTYTATGLASFQRYYFRVRTRGDGDSVSVPSSTVNTVTTAGPVTAMATSSITTTRVVIDWLDTNGEANYRVQRSTDGVNNWTNRGSNLAPNTPSYTDTGTTGTTYFYRVQTLDSGGNVVATSPVVSESTRLSTVSGLVFTNQAANQLAMTWNSVTNATGYRVERSLDNSTFTTIAGNVTTASYADNAVSAGVTYYYRVVGLKAGLTESAAASSVISATVPTAAAAAASAEGVASSSQPKDTSAALAAASASSSETKSLVRSAIHKFEKQSHTNSITSRQRAAIEHVLANWDFDRRDRELSRALLSAINRAKATTPGISLGNLRG